MDKQKKLQKILEGMRRVVVAYSGGLDSTFLLKSAIDALGAENVLAVTARSETYPISEYKEAVAVAGALGARHYAMRTSELGIRNFKENPVNRCYYCKKELFKKLTAIAKKRKMCYVLDGTNRDDLGDVRYGRLAAKEFGIKSPLLDAGITKDEVRAFSRKLGLPTSDKPSMACLASRIPFHTRITAQNLQRVGSAEDALKKLGFWQVRVRAHGDIARLEIARKDFAKMMRLRCVVDKKLKKLGFIYVALDLAGYRTGSMHEVPGAR